MSTLTALGSKEAEMRMIGCDLHAAQQSITPTIVRKKIEDLRQLDAFDVPS
jgi:hypothetical protein